MTALHKNRVKMTVTSVAGGGTGTITLNAASSGYQSFASAYGANATVDVMIVEGTAWEVARNCAYTHSGTTLTRGTLEASSTGSAISLTSAAVVSVVSPAARGNSLESALQAVTPGGRLTLESGVPVSTAANKVAVSGQDTAADTITVTAHGWPVATMITSSATSGGLTAGTQYYAGSITANTISVHTTVAGALAGTGKVDITGAVTANITASGIANTSIYYTPYVHNIINLWDGSNWVPTEFTEKTLALGTLTSGKPYDVFGYLSAGALVLESLVWTSDSARATAVTLQDGRYCKSGDKTRLLLGTFYTTSTTTTESSETKPFLVNLYNTVPVRSRSAGRYSTNASTTTGPVVLSTNLDCSVLLCVPTIVEYFATIPQRHEASVVITDAYVGVRIGGVDYTATVSADCWSATTALLSLPTTGSFDIGCPAGKIVASLLWGFAAGASPVVYKGADRGSASGRGVTDVFATYMA